MYTDYTFGMRIPVESRDDQDVTLKIDGELQTYAGRGMTREMQGKVLRNAADA